MEKKKIVLKNFTEDELKEFMKTIDEKPFRGSQIFSTSWIVHVLYTKVPPTLTYLADVPCSGFGIIRRKPEIKYKKEEELKDITSIQKKIF